MNKPDRSHTPRVTCPPECPAYKTSTGCGFLDSGMPCGHHEHRRRVGASIPAAVNEYAADAIAAQVEGADNE